RLETAIPSAPSHTPRLGVVEPVCCDLHLDLYIRSLDAHGVSRNASWGGRTKRFAGLDVVDGPMPRACDLRAGHLALREGAVTAKCLSGTPRGPGLDRSRVIAQDALLLVTEPVGLQHLLQTLCARHHEGHGSAGVARVGAR